MIFSPTAGMRLSELGQHPLNPGGNGLSDGSGITTVKDVDAHLLESHQGSHPHAAGNEDLDAVVRQMIHRRHAASLLMGYIRDHPNILDNSLLQGEQSIDFAMPEMGADGGLQAARR